MMNETIPSIIINTGINRCRTAVSNITIPAVVTITTITMIAVSSLPVLGCYYYQY